MLPMANVFLTRFASMKLSFFIPTNRTNTRAYAAILNICALAGNGVEVIIRDNSGSAEKKEFLSQFQSDHCRFYPVDYCTPYENLKETAALTSGEFVFGVSDDDYFDPMALPTLMRCIDAISDDPSYSGVGGDMIYSKKKVTELVKFMSMDNPDTLERYKQFDKSHATLLWSAHRRSRYMEAMSFVRSLPIEFSFHDSMFNLLMTISGRYIDIGRILYFQDMTNWDALRQGDFALFDIFYVKAGLDRALYALEWVISFYEGSRIILDSKFTAHLPEQERHQIGYLWCKYFYSCFQGAQIERLKRRDKASPKLLSPLEESIDKLCAKWHAGRVIILSEILQEIVDIFAMSNPKTAKAYNDFWSRFADAAA
jgi:hypothetical protein